MNNERIKNQNEFNTVGRAIAVALGATFEAPEGEIWILNCDIILATGESIYLSVREGRLSVSANWPRDGKNYCYTPSSYDHTDYTSITISLAKTPERIAKEITSRFLPGFLPEYNKQLARAKGSDDAKAKKRAGIARLAEAFGRLAPGGDVTEATFYCGDSLYVKAEAYCECASVNLTNLSYEQAEAVLKLVKTFNTGE